MTIDISKIKQGDKVTLVPLEVLATLPGAVRIWFPRFGDIVFSADLIAAHHPAQREFQVGDRVRLKEGSVAGTVRGVDCDEVWVKWGKPINPPVMLADYLTLVEAGQ